MEPHIKILIAATVVFTSMWVIDNSEARIAEMQQTVPEVAPLVSSSSPPRDTSGTNRYPTLGYPEVETTTTTTTTTTEPLPVWMGGLPAYYGVGSECTRNEASIIARAMWAYGASDLSVEWMLNVVSRESLCDSAAHNGDRTTGDDSWGLCQQNKLAGWFDRGALLERFDPAAFADDFELNARSCALMWSVCGEGPWTRGDYGCEVPEELR